MNAEQKRLAQVLGAQRRRGTELVGLLLYVRRTPRNPRSWECGRRGKQSADRFWLALGHMGFLPALAYEVRAIQVRQTERTENSELQKQKNGLRGSTGLRCEVVRRTFSTQAYTIERTALSAEHQYAKMTSTLCSIWSTAVSSSVDGQ